MEDPQWVQAGAIPPRPPQHCSQGDSDKEACQGVKVWLPSIHVTFCTFVREHSIFSAVLTKAAAPY